MFPSFAKPTKGTKMTPPRRRLAVAGATLTLAVLTTACGALGQAVDCNTAANDAAKIATEWSSTVTKDAANGDAVEAASKTAETKTKELMRQVRRRSRRRAQRPRGRLRLHQGR